MVAPPLLSSRRLALALAPAATFLLALVVGGGLSPLLGGIAVTLLVVGGWWSCSASQPPSPDPAPKAPPVPAPLGDGLLESLPDPVLIIDTRRRIVAANAGARETLSITTVGRDLALSLRHPEALQAADEALTGGRPVIKEEVRLATPAPRTFTLYATALRGEAGSDGVVLVLRDETRARRAERSRADFVANASHELRSPLSALIGFIETLRGPATDDTAARERFLRLMHAEATRMSRLIDDLMSLVRVEIDEHVPPKDAVRLDDLLRIIAETLHARAADKHMAIDIDCPGDLPDVIGDDDQLIQVFHNLVDNAIKYGRDSTPIALHARFVERHPEAGVPGVIVTVSDQGDGIAPEHLPRLTERFYRADAGRSRRMGGTGLGLAIVKHIVNRHRGRLSITSELKVGSTVSVFLPCVVDASGTSRPSSPS